MKKKILVLFLILSLMGSIIGCGSDKDESKGKKKKDSISIFIGSGIFDSSLDPIKGAMSSGYSFTNCALIRVNENSKYEGDLATDWITSDDGLEYTFNLREGVKFQDGSIFNADDVVFTYEKVKDNQGENEKVDLSKLKSVEAVNDILLSLNYQKHIHLL